MKIGINALCVENRSGTGRYASQLLRALAELDDENRYCVWLPADSPLRNTLDERANFRPIPVNAHGALRRHLFERRRLSASVASHHLDLFHGLAFLIPQRLTIPSIVTIHDLVFQLFPETVPWTRRRHYRREIARSIAQANKILCVSEHTARDLERHMRQPSKKLAIVPEGVEPRFFDSPNETLTKTARETYRLPERFILALSTLEPRKNIPALLRAYARLIERRADAPDLVLAGRKGWGVRGLASLAKRLGISNRVRFPGFIADEDLPTLYRQAEVFAHVAIYEGFGLPILEAMASGTPIVAGRNSSIPEVTGDTASLVDVTDSEEIAHALDNALENPEAACERAKTARKRAKTFTWRAAAEKTLALYQTIARAPLT